MNEIVASMMILFSTKFRFLLPNRSKLHSVSEFNLLMSKLLLIKSAQTYPTQSYPLQSYHLLSNPTLSSPIFSYPILFIPIISYPILFYSILSYPILSYPILSYPILSYPILSYPILSYPIQLFRSKPSSFLSYSTPSDVLICLYNTLFLSVSQYGLIVWGQTHVSYIDPIFKLQRKAVRAISFQPRMSPSLPIFNDLKLLPLSGIFELCLLSFAVDSASKTSPSCFHDLSYSTHLFISILHQ